MVGVEQLYDRRSLWSGNEAAIPVQSFTQLIAPDSNDSVSFTVLINVASLEKVCVLHVRYVLRDAVDGGRACPPMNGKEVRVCCSTQTKSQ